MDLPIELLKAAFLGLVEGITEWLPVSSTGHMILVDEFVRLDVSESFWNMFLVVIQLGAILSVVVQFFRELNPFAPSKGPEGRRSTWRLWGKIVLGCVPAAAIGLPLNDLMEEHLYNAQVVAAMLILYGVAFILVENWRARRAAGRAVAGRPEGSHFAGPAGTAPDGEDGDFGRIASLDEMGWRTALGIGCFQVLSLVPGTSRSGATIIGGLLLGTTRSVATRFTFFLAIPVMLGASLLKIAKFLLAGNAMTGAEWAILGVGMAVAFGVSLASIAWLTGFVRRHDFKPFGWYRIVLGVVVLAYFAFLAG